MNSTVTGSGPSPTGPSPTGPGGGSTPAASGGDAGGLDVDTAPRADAQKSFAGFGWAIQPLVCVLAVIAVLVYTNTRELTTNQALLENSQIAGMFSRHLWVTVIAAIVVVILAVPLGILLTRGPLRRCANAILALAGFGQAAPAVGLVVLSALIFGVGVLPFILALVVYGILPVVANVVAGLNSVDPKLIEAGRGMGMSAGLVLRKVELPIAVPVILTGVRTAVILICGTAAFGGFVGAGGLGSMIGTGIKLGNPPLLICGAILIAALALFLDWVARVIEVAAAPKALS